MSVWLNLGGGALVRGGVFAAGPDPRLLEAADFDGDGDVDLVAADRSSGEVSLLLNFGDATFFDGATAVGRRKRFS